MTGPAQVLGYTSRRQRPSSDSGYFRHQHHTPSILLQSIDASEGRRADSFRSTRNQSDTARSGNCSGRPVSFGLVWFVSSGSWQHLHRETALSSSQRPFLRSLSLPFRNNTHNIQTDTHTTHKPNRGNVLPDPVTTSLRSNLPQRFYSWMAGEGESQDPSIFA